MFHLNSIIDYKKVLEQGAKEFQLDYNLNTWQIASGLLVIEYDSEMFAFEELTCGSFFRDKVVDVNADLPGAIYVSFAGTQYSGYTQLLTVKFRTLQNLIVIIICDPLPPSKSGGRYFLENTVKRVEIQ